MAIAATSPYSPCRPGGEAAAAHTGLLAGWHSGGADEGGGRGRPARSRRWRLLSACLGVGAAAALVAGVVTHAPQAWRSALMPRRGERDGLGNTRISGRYRTLWKPGENATKPCRQNPWPHRLPGRCAAAASACASVGMRDCGRAPAAPPGTRGGRPVVGGADLWVCAVPDGSTATGTRASIRRRIWTAPTRR